VLYPIFTTDFEPNGNILLDKKRTATDKDSSFREERYSERKFTFIFLLVVPRIFSHKCTKCEKWVEISEDRTEFKPSTISSQIQLVIQHILIETNDFN
jgi:hypothetical protein